MAEKNNWIKDNAVTLLLIILLLWGVKHDWFKSESSTTIQYGFTDGNLQNPIATNTPIPGATATPSSVLCTDGDGGQNFEVTSYCEDAATQTGHADSCHGYTAVDWYCNSNNVCQDAIKICNYPYETCIEGTCGHMPCSSIINPPMFETCVSGSCPTGQDCNYIGPTISTPARCECGVNLD